MKCKLFLLTIIIFISTLNFNQVNAQIKSTKTTIKSDIDGKSHTSESLKFNKNGDTIQIKEYYSDGEVKNEKYFSYTNGKVTEKIEKGIDIKDITKITYDEISNSKTSKVYRNNDLIYEFTETFDDNDHILKISQDVKGGKLTKSYSYLLNENEKIIEIKSTIEDVTQIYKTFTYDENGNQIEVLKHGPYLNYKTVTEYKDNRIYRILKTRITKGNSENVDSDIIYDDFFNPIHTKTYNEEKLISESKINYIFDKKGNWIKKIVLTKDLIFDRSKKFKPNYTATRKLKYWN